MLIYHQYCSDEYPAHDPGGCPDCARTKPKVVPGLSYLVVFLESNLPEIAESSGYDVAAVAGDAASLGRIVREAPQMVEALHLAVATIERCKQVAEAFEAMRKALRWRGCESTYLDKPSCGEKLPACTTCQAVRLADKVMRP